MSISHTITTLRNSTRRTLSGFLLVSLFAWAVGLPLVLEQARAAGLSNFTDTISDSRPSALTNHVIAFTNASTVTTLQTMKIQFDPSTDSFDLSALVGGDISVTGMTLVANVGACSGAASEVYPTIDSTAPDESVTLTVCAGDTVSVGAKTVTLANAHIANPAVQGSYVIHIGGTQSSTSDTRIAIITATTMNAQVDTTFTFSIAGVATGQAVNGTTTSTTTSATAIAFGTLVAGVPRVGAQDLTVTTNAGYGFAVSVYEDQKLTSSGGATIDIFSNGATTSVPAVWTPPTNLAGQHHTWGHLGVTSDDADLNGGEFISAKFAGNFTSTSSPRTIFSNVGPADGTTQNVGKARVGWAIQVGPLQEAGTDYTNAIVYVATPTF